MISFAIPDMTCNGCVAAITRAVRAVDSGAEVVADLGAHTAEIESQASAEALTAAIAEAGFTVQQAG